MALAVLTISCFLFYGTSKYFPLELTGIVKVHRIKIIITASAISLLSLYLFTADFGFGTGLMIWLVAFMTILSAVILSIKMSLQWVWFWGLLCVLFFMINLS